jgi:hypothetical protein
MLLSLDRDELEEGLEAAKARSGASLEADLEKLSVEDSQPMANDLVGTPGPSSRLGLDIGPPISPVRPWQPDLPSILTVYIVGIAKAQSYPEIICTHPFLDISYSLFLHSKSIHGLTKMLLQSCLLLSGHSLTSRPISLSNQGLQTNLM